MCEICNSYGIKDPNILSDQFLHQYTENAPPKYLNSDTQYQGLFSDYTFYHLGNKNYQIKTIHGFDEITNISKLIFTDRTISTFLDIKSTFDLITGLNTNDAKIFRLYNATTKGLADSKGLKYWINQLDKNDINESSIVKELMLTSDFTEIYGSDGSHKQYINSLYKNILNRKADSSGFSYWLGQLNRGQETKEEVFLGFTESDENKSLFSEMTGFR